MTLAIVLALAVGCAGTTTITELPVVAPPAAAPAGPAGDDHDSTAEPVEEPEPAAADGEGDHDEQELTATLIQSDDESPDEGSEADESQDDGEGAQPNGRVAQVRAAEARVFAERRAVLNTIGRERFDVFHPDPTPLETESLPSTEWLQASRSGRTVHITGTVAWPGVDEPMAFETAANIDTGYVHTRTERAAYAAWLAAHAPLRASVRPIGSGVVETVYQSESWKTWTRGLSSNLDHYEDVPMDTDRWYNAPLIERAIVPTFAYTTDEELWDELLAESDLAPPSPEQDGSRTIRTGTFDEHLPVLLGDVATTVVGAARTGMYTVTTVADASGLVELVEVTKAVAGERGPTVTLVVMSRGEPIDVPAIDDVLQHPGTQAVHIAADRYTWAARADMRGSGGEAGATWSAEGRVLGGYYPDSLLSMPARSIAVLGGIDLVDTSPDHVVRRSGYLSVPYAVGLFPEMLPWAATDSLDPEAKYVHDPFGVPADLFPHGLSDEDQWRALAAVPQIVTLEGWNHSRVTQGTVDPGYWSWRHRSDTGFFAWIASESTDEIFEVTVGADESGRMQRFRITATDPDGSGLTFDVTLDPVPAEPLELNGRVAWLDARADSDADAEDSGAEPAPADRLEAFAVESRRQYPVFDHARRPEHLTLLTERVRDEPSGAYEPDGEYFRWPSVSFEREQIVARLPDGRDVVCLELEDNEWRSAPNTFEHLWRAFEHEGSLDGRILRYNTNAWRSMEIYATDGPRLSDDPCVFLRE